MLLPEEKLSEMKHAMRDDIVMQALNNAIQKNWYGSTNSEMLKPYAQLKNELILEDGLVFKVDRLVVPRVMRRAMMELLHQGHTGIEGCLRHAGEVIYWPNMYAELKDYISRCDICNAT